MSELSRTERLASLRTEILTLDRAVEASALLAGLFAEKECITRCIGLSAAYYRIWSDLICQRAAQLGVSTITLNESNQVIATCICIDGGQDDSEEDDDPEGLFYPYDVLMHRLQTRLRLKRGYQPLHKDGDWIFEGNDVSQLPEMPEGKYMHILMLGCHPEYQGLGLVQALCKKSIDLSIKAGYDDFFMETTNTRSQKTARSLGFKCELIINYKLFQDDHGVRLFKNMDPAQPFVMLFTYKPPAA